MKFLLLALFVYLQAGAQLHPQHNRYHPTLPDDEAIALYKDFLITNGVSGRCHQTSKREEEIKWKFREHQGTLVAEALNDNFISPAGRSWRVEIGPLGNFRILTGKFKISYNLVMGQVGERYTFDVTSHKLDYYSETDNGPDIAGLCLSASKGDLAAGKPEKIYVVKPAPPAPTPKPTPPRTNARVKSVKKSALKVCPLERELAREFLLANDVRILAKKTYRESEVPQILDFEFLEREGKLLARTKQLLFHHQFTLLIETGHNASLYPVEIFDCSDYKIDTGKFCKVQIQFPMAKVDYEMNIPDRTLERPVSIGWECLAQSNESGWFSGWGRSCEIISIEKASTIVARSAPAPFVPKCRLESASGD